MAKKHFLFIAALIALGGAIVTLREEGRGYTPVNVVAGVRRGGLTPVGQVDVSLASAYSMRRPAAHKEGLQGLLDGSLGEWTIDRNAAGFVTRLSGASYPSRHHGQAAAPDEFLGQYALSLLGVAPNKLAVLERRVSSHSTQVVYEQVANGLPILGSRVNMIFSPEGDLHYLAAATYPGVVPAPTPKFNQIEAAAAIRAALELYLSRVGGSIASPEYDLGRITAACGLSYRLSGDSISLIYKAEFPMASPGYGALEALVDAQTNTVVLLRPTAKR